MHVKLHALDTQAAAALGTLVEHTVEHEPQWLGLLVVLTHVSPLQRVGAVPGHPETHDDAEQMGVPLSAPHARPHPPQLVLLVAVLTHAPPHSVNPLAHVKVQALLTHAAVALATLVVQVCPHVLQLFGSLVVSAQPLGQTICAPGQFEAHTYELPDIVQSGRLVGHALPQLPQLAAVVYWTHAPLQSE